MWVGEQLTSTTLSNQLQLHIRNHKLAGCNVMNVVEVQVLLNVIQFKHRRHTQMYMKTSWWLDAPKHMSRKYPHSNEERSRPSVIASGIRSIRLFNSESENATEN